MSRPFYQSLPMVPHAGYLGEQHSRPEYLRSAFEVPEDNSFWPFYAGGSHGQIQLHNQTFRSEVWDFEPGIYQLRCYFLGQYVERRAHLGSDGCLETAGKGLMSGPGAAFLAELERNGESWTVLLRELSTEKSSAGYTQRFALFRTLMQRTDREIAEQMPEPSAVQFQVSIGEQRPVYPIQLGPSVLDVTGRRIPLTYQEGVERLADLLLAHRPPYGRTLVYLDGQLDYFAHFALQEVGRLLGIRVLEGSVALGARALSEGALFQLGSEVPSVAIDMALNGTQRLFILNGWNGFVTHLPLFERLLQACEQEGNQVYLIETRVSESAKVLAERLGPERVLLVRPGAESHLALALAHVLFKEHPEAVADAFLEDFADTDSFDAFADLARSEAYALEQIVPLIAPEDKYQERLSQAIPALAAQLAESASVPVHLPGAGLWHSTGMVGGCLWTNLWALLGKLGLSSEGELLGGELRLFERQNEACQLSHLGSDRFFGGLPLDEAGCREAAQRMDLPADHYLPLLSAPRRSLLDFVSASDSEAEHEALPELILCLGNGLEADWMRAPERWREKLRSGQTTLVTVDMAPGPLSLQAAALCLPPPPPVAGHHLILTGEWRLIQRFPRRQAPPETRTETTLLYDVMAEISRVLREDEMLRQHHPDLAKLLDDGYLQVRFEPPEWGWGGHLQRRGGEVDREQLWERIQSYLGAEKPLLGRAEKGHQQALSWSELTELGDYLLGSLRERLTAGASPFQDLHRQAVKFRFFVPHEADLRLADEPLLSVGSTQPGADWGTVRFAIATAHSDLPLEHDELPTERWLYLSPAWADELGLQDGDGVRVLAADGQLRLRCPVRRAPELKGRCAYFHHYLTRQELQSGAAYPWLLLEPERCPHSDVPLWNKIPIQIEKDPDYHG